MVKGGVLATAAVSAAGAAVAWLCSKRPPPLSAGGGGAPPSGLTVTVGAAAGGGAPASPCACAARTPASIVSSNPATKGARSDWSRMRRATQTIVRRPSVFKSDRIDSHAVPDALFSAHEKDFRKKSGAARQQGRARYGDDPRRRPPKRARAGAAQRRGERHEGRPRGARRGPQDRLVGGPRGSVSRSVEVD